MNYESKYIKKFKKVARSYLCNIFILYISRAIDKIIWNQLLIRKVVNTTNFYNNNNINFK